VVLKEKIGMERALASMDHGRVVKVFESKLEARRRTGRHRLR
jgi:hypothetical protein